MVKDFEVPEQYFGNILIGLHLKCLRCFGYIVSEGQRFKHFRLMKATVFIVLHTILCLIIIVKVSIRFTGLVNDANNFAGAFSGVSFSIIAVNALFQRKRFVRLVLFLHRDFTELYFRSDKAEEVMLAKTIKYLNIINASMWLPCFAVLFILTADCLIRTAFKPETVFNVPQVLNGTARPIYLFHLYPTGQMYDNFIVGYLGPFCLMYVQISIIPCWHCYNTSLMQYIVLRISVVAKRLREYDFGILSPNLDVEKIKSLSDKDLMYWHSKMSGYFIQEQMKFKWIIGELGSLIKIPVFCDTIVFPALMCFLAYAVSVGNFTVFDYFVFSIHLFVITFILWLYHWHASLITESNNSLCFAIYSSPWYLFPVVVQKNIRLMMMACGKPLVMKAIFIELNLKTFVNVFRGGYSYFSILQNVNMSNAEDGRLKKNF